MTLTLAAQLPASIGTDLWDIQIPPVEKIIRTVLVYVAIVAIIRVAGKRLMAQMNSLDLVVVLLLSNVVQNAIIGDDNSITGGVIGAIVLVVVNAAAERIAQVWPAFRTLVEGRPTVVVRDGALIEGSLDRLGVNASELQTALRGQGADGIDEVDLATFDPGGSITVDVKRAEQALSYGEFTAAMARLEARLDSLTPPAVH